MKALTALSICIPVYNSIPDSLLKAVLQQMHLLPKGTEVLVADDGSHAEFREANRHFCEKHNISYLQEAQNRGRAAIRNTLARNAVGEWLLFLDADVLIPDGNYLKNYFSYRLPHGVVCGGVHYLTPQEKGYELRHRYGLIRECKPAAERRKKPWQSFKTNNFLVHSSVLTKVQFDESLKNYGHEDTLFGLQLMQKGIIVKHINLPTHHAISDTNTAFLEKAEAALHNLHHIMQKYPQLGRYFKLYRLGFYLRKTGLSPLFLKWASSRLAQWKKQLRAGNASLSTFDLYRLYLLLAPAPR